MKPLSENGIDRSRLSVDGGSLYQRARKMVDFTKETIELAKTMKTTIKCRGRSEKKKAIQTGEDCSSLFLRTLHLPF